MTYLSTSLGINNTFWKKKNNKASILRNLHYLNIHLGPQIVDCKEYPCQFYYSFGFKKNKNPSVEFYYK